MRYNVTDNVWIFRDDFGNIATNSTEAIGNAFKYVGKYGVQTDAPDLLFMRARYYMPSVGRFVNKDPIGFKASINFYVYGRNNPIKYIDPLGMESIIPSIDQIYDSLPENVQNVTATSAYVVETVTDGFLNNALGVCEAGAEYYKTKPVVEQRIGYMSGQWDESNPIAQTPTVQNTTTNAASPTSTISIQQ